MNEWREIHRHRSVAVAALLMLLLSPGVLGEQYRLPLLPSASEPLRQGMVRIVNHSAEAGEVAVTAIDDAGLLFGPVTLAVEAQQAIEFSATDLEQGNAAKGIVTGIGAGQGDWRLVLDTTLDIEPLAYVQTPAGFVERLHELVPPTWFYHRVALVGPDIGGQHDGQLRLINAADSEAHVVIFGLDDEGALVPGQVHLVLPAGAARTVSASELETGTFGLTGALGDSEGDWRLLVFADSEVGVMTLLDSVSGPLANLSAAAADEGDIPLFPSTADAVREGLLRITTRSQAGDVRIHAVDDAGREYGPVTLTVESGASVQLTSSDLENGNAEKGLPIGLGSGEGDWRLRLESDLDLQVLVYARTQNGFVTTIHDVAARGDSRHHVPFFNPASDTQQASRLRLINPTDNAAQIVIRAWDDEGNTAPDGAVSFTLAAGVSRSISAEALEEGAEGLTGSLGHGEGKWRLSVQADQPIRVMSLVESSEGHLTNLSTAATLPGFLKSCIGGPVDSDGDGVSDHCDRDPDTALRALSGCADGTYIEEPDGDPGLVEDCRVLIRIANLQAQGDALPEDHVLQQWGIGEDTRIGSWDGIVVSKGRVTEIRLAGTNQQPGGLTGFIPLELGQLTALAVLDLSYNELTGPIPPALGRLANLTVLKLNRNRLSGRIPAELGQIGNLRQLWLSNNELTGSIPAELGQLANLTRLLLGTNELVGEIPPQLGRLTQLTWLTLNNNRLNGRLPPELGQLLRLQHLGIRANVLTGMIPPELGHLTNLRALDLSGNALSGAIPSELGQLVNLRTMNLYANDLTGSIPPELGNLGDLEVLQLWSNELSGPIPGELGRLAKLRSLSLTNNRLTGRIPSQLGQLVSVNDVRLGNNALTGAIPPELGNLANLVNLDLSRNLLSGSIPSELATAVQLKTLRVSSNRLSGTIPWAFWGRIASGELELDFAGNVIGGFAPPPHRTTRPVYSSSPTENGNATHESVSYYQGPLVWSWNWQDDAVEHQRPILGRWAALAVRIEHEVPEPPVVITRVLDGEGNVLAARLGEAAPPATVSTGAGQWRTAYVFELPGSLYREGNRIVHVIDPDNDMAETDENDNVGAPIRLYGEEPPRFRVKFIPLHFPGHDPPSVDPDVLMAGTRAFLPIADDFEAMLGSAIESDVPGKYELIDEVLALWNAEAAANEFYHGIFNAPWPGDARGAALDGGLALRSGRVAVSRVSVHKTIPHEFGHNLSLDHPPGCGARGLDENYPYPDGALGMFPGWEVNWRRFVSSDDSGYADVMSYCGTHSFVSDYSYRKASDYWRSTHSAAETSAMQSNVQVGVRSRFTPASANQPSGRAPQASSGSESAGALALSGRVDASGVWNLTHARISERAPRPPAPDGAHTLVLIDGDGIELYREPLSANVFSEGDGAGWAARTPIPPRPAREVTILNALGETVLVEELPLFE